MEKNKDFISPLTLKIDKNIWNKFKDLVHRDTTLNDGICLLIQDFVSKGDKVIDLRKAR